MNNKDLEEREEFWDDEVEDDDEDNYNGVDGNIDANNDETFGNSAEWNEDEHEELIARDLILSNTRQRSNRNTNSSSNNNNHNSSGNNSRSNRHDHIDGSNARTMGQNHSRNDSGRDTQHFALFAQAAGSSSRQAADWSSPKAAKHDDILSHMKQRSMQEQPGNDMSWQDALGATQRMQLLQLQQQAQEQLRLLSQSRLLIEQDQARLQQMSDQRRLLQQRQQQQAEPDLMFAQQDPSIFNAGSSSMQKPVSQPKVLTVDELERQLLKTSINQSPQQPPRGSRTGPEPSRRAGWSPFGSKDIFNTDEPVHLPSGLLDACLLQNIQPQSLTLEQQRMILEQQKLLQHQQQLQRLALFEQQQHQQHQQHQRQQHQLNQQRQVHQQQQLQHQQQNTDPKLMSSSAQCFTVEELERQMLANRANKTQETETKKKVAPAHPEGQARAARHETTPRHQSDDNRQRNQDRRNGERHDRFDRHNNHREFDDSREHQRENRDNKNHRDHFRHHKKEPTIIPPQVQLGVIDKAKRMHSITAMHSDEFLQDRMPTSGDGFRFMRHSKVSGVKANHDGVLTAKERDWLTRIQEKIQADYDDNIDQDYYYLLYFNRSSITDEAAQKPSGPGVFDRRFIPRERLLYNSGV